MNKYHAAMLAVVLLIGAASLSAQASATLDTSLNANFTMGAVAFGTTPVLVPAGGVADVETGIRNVQAALNAAGWTLQVITTNTFDFTIHWGHEINANSNGNGQMIVATGANSAGQGGGATATNTGTLGSAYATGGHSIAGVGNFNGGNCQATANGGNDCWAEAFGGDAVGIGVGGSATANASVNVAASRGEAVATGGAAAAGAAGTGGAANATGDGNAVANGGNADPTVGASTGGAATAVTLNGANLAPATAATANGGTGGTGGACTATGPNSGGPLNGPAGGSVSAN